MQTRFIAEWIEEWEPETAPCDKTKTAAFVSLAAAKHAAMQNANDARVFPWCEVKEQVYTEGRGWQTVSRWVGDYDEWEQVVEA